MIAFFDLEVKPPRITDIGAVFNGQSFRDSNKWKLLNFVKKAQYLGGHNILRHDLKYLNDISFLKTKGVIDTLPLSALLFPTKVSQALVKDYKVNDEVINNPLLDAQSSLELFNGLCRKFEQLDQRGKIIFYYLLRNSQDFSAFFDYYLNQIEDFDDKSVNLIDAIKSVLAGKICDQAPLPELINTEPVALAFSLSYLFQETTQLALSPWIRKTYPETEIVLTKLRSATCHQCDFCLNFWDIQKGLERFSNHKTFRQFNGVELQKNTVQCAVNGDSLLAVFPTGGGKSFTFQLPALMAGAALKALTVVISPLQALMKDQVDNLSAAGIKSAVTIHSGIDPLERWNAFQKVYEGQADLLYISPELLRYPSIFKAIKHRNVIRFVIDEAHCLSTWGHDFRVEYLYIAQFIKKYQAEKGDNYRVAVSCVTATAQKEIKEDITSYFKRELGLELTEFIASPERANLTYSCSPGNKMEDLVAVIRKYHCPTIVYAATRKATKEVADSLKKRGIKAVHYHGKLNAEEKKDHQDRFLNNDIQVMVATNAFGMGVDKKDIGLVVHVDLPGSLENYLQEAGRAGRDPAQQAHCVILYSEESVETQFQLLKASRLQLHEIQGIWHSLSAKRTRNKTHLLSALEIARGAGFDESRQAMAEGRVKGALQALDNAEFLERGDYEPKVLATGILVNSKKEALTLIAEAAVDEEQKELARVMVDYLIQVENTHNQIPVEHSGINLETRIDYLAAYLQISRVAVLDTIAFLKDIAVLADSRDYVAQWDLAQDQVMNRLDLYYRIFKAIIHKSSKSATVLRYRELASEVAEEGEIITVREIKTAILLLVHLQILSFEKLEKNFVRQVQLPISPLEAHGKIDLLKTQAQLIAERLLSTDTQGNKFEFSLLEIKNLLAENGGKNLSYHQIEAILFYFYKINLLHIEGLFLLSYTPMQITLLKEPDAEYGYEQYQYLEAFYDNRAYKIHVINEYAKILMDDPARAQRLALDYFTIPKKEFLEQYFPNRTAEVSMLMTKAVAKQLFAELTTEQKQVVDDTDSQVIVVHAGPGSGKTKILISKVFALMRIESVQPEQVLMLTFSRSAVAVFKQRLQEIKAGWAEKVPVMTFHSYAFEILNQQARSEQLNQIVSDATAAIINQNADLSLITKRILIIDEAQDLSEEEYRLIMALKQFNPALKIIAVGDDDQAIYEFRASSPVYMERLVTLNATQYFLTKNFRSKKTIVDLLNYFAPKIMERQKTDQVFTSNDEECGTVNVIKYQGQSFLADVCNQVTSLNLPGETAILTLTNDQAVMMQGLLENSNVFSHLIRASARIRYVFLAEIQYFLAQLGEEDNAPLSAEVIEEAIGKMKELYENSSVLAACLQYLEGFRNQEEALTKSRIALDLFEANEIVEDLPQNAIHISTIHQAKGRQFDNVFLVLQHHEGLKEIKDEQLRTFYVGLSRAKSNLLVHTNLNLFDDLKLDHIPVSKQQASEKVNVDFTYRCSHQDVNLGDFKTSQPAIDQLVSGDSLKILNNEIILAEKTRSVLRFSNKFLWKLEQGPLKHYQITNVKVGYVIYWAERDQHHSEAIKIILPELTFIRKKRN